MVPEIRLIRSLNVLYGFTAFKRGFNIDHSHEESRYVCMEVDQCILKICPRKARDSSSKSQQIDSFNCFDDDL